MTPEGRVKEDVKKILKKHNIWYFMPAANGFGKVGVPDFICCWDGKFLAVETKAPGKLSNLTPNQQNRIDEIRSARGWALVIDDAKALEEFINERTEERL